jgi:hypothetical protein
VTIGGSHVALELHMLASDDRKTYLKCGGILFAIACQPKGRSDSEIYSIMHAFGVAFCLIALGRAAGLAIPSSVPGADALFLTTPAGAHARARRTSIDSREWPPCRFFGRATSVGRAVVFYLQHLTTGSLEMHLRLSPCHGDHLFSGFRVRLHCDGVTPPSADSNLCLQAVRRSPSNPPAAVV